MAVILDVKEWAEQQFGACGLGDRRRTERLVKFAAQAAEKPDAATTEQTETWADLKAAYRLVDQEDVTFDAITAPHRELTRAAMRDDLWLIISDTSELNFGYLSNAEGLGRLGCPDGRGFFLHSAIAARASDGALAGVVAHELYTRPVKKLKRVSSRARKQRTQRETDVWGRVIDTVGPPPAGVQLLHVCDRGADNFDVYCHLIEQRAGWVIRAAQLTRQVRSDQTATVALDSLVGGAPCLGSYDLTVTANTKQPARTARMEVRAVPLAMPRPRSGVSQYARQTGLPEITMWAVETREVSPVPAGVKPLRWVLLTSEETTTFDQAWTIISHYEKRWLIEEYHKCLKTGCQIESRQYRTSHRLEAVIGLTSVLSVRLLQLKQIARSEPHRPAADVVPKRWRMALSKLLRRPRPTETVRDFFRALASLGGFLCRTSDGEPGWQTIWRGLDTLLIAVRVLVHKR